jgi:TPP-dependent pyruvate/acetoin dehydrogenase alpha subunit
MRDVGYRTVEEVNAWKERCPIELFRRRLLAEGSARDDEFAAMEAEVAAEVGAAVQFALDSPWPDPTTATEHVYSVGP